MKTEAIHAAVPAAGNRLGLHPVRVGSHAAQERMRATPGEPLFLADWLEVTMLHFDVAPERLQRLTPLPLDYCEGRTFVTLVAFEMVNMRLRKLPRLSRMFFAPFTRSRFLNLRTYVQTADGDAIQFLVEWLSNPISVLLGPPVYGLPYLRGRLRYGCCGQQVSLDVTPASGGGCFEAELETVGEQAICEEASLDEFLMERYTAFTVDGRRRRRFHIWHGPWRQTRCRVKHLRDDLLAATFPELAGARLVEAHHSPGVRDVWMSRPFDL
jgi:uncharacterized protein YqjF (DUF2071 family)